MTQQYIVGEFSCLLSGLQSAPGELLGDAVASLRHEVEFGPLPMLPRLAQEALTLADMICRDALDQGDAEGFCRCLGAAIALRDFTAGAGLLRWCPSRQ
jgi:hypothetical protein